MTTCPCAGIDRPCFGGPARGVAATCRVQIQTMGTHRSHPLDALFRPEAAASTPLVALRSGGTRRRILCFGIQPPAVGARREDCIPGSPPDPSHAPKTRGAKKQAGHFPTFARGGVGAAPGPRLAQPVACPAPSFRRCGRNTRYLSLFLSLQASAVVLYCIYFQAAVSPKPRSTPLQPKGAWTRWLFCSASCVPTQVRGGAFQCLQCAGTAAMCTYIQISREGDRRTKRGILVGSPRKSKISWLAPATASAWPAHCIVPAMIYKLCEEEKRTTGHCRHGMLWADSDRHP